MKMCAGSIFHFPSARCRRGSRFARVAADPAAVTGFVTSAAAGIVNDVKETT